MIAKNKHQDWEQTKTMIDKNKYQCWQQQN